MEVWLEADGHLLEDCFVDLSDIAARLDSDEKLTLKYRVPVRSANGDVDYEVRTGRVLDVAEAAQLLYVSHEDEVIWVKLDEAIEVESQSNT